MSDEKKVDPVAAALARAAEKNGTKPKAAAAKPAAKPVETPKAAAPASDTPETSAAAADAPAKDDVEPSVHTDGEAPHKPAEEVVIAEGEVAVDVPADGTFPPVVDNDGTQGSGSVVTHVALVKDTSRGQVFTDTVKLDVPLTHRQVLEAPHVPQIDGRGGYGGAGWGRKG